MQKRQEMCILSLGQEDALEEEMATHPVFLPGKSQERGSWQATVHGVAKSRTQLSDFTSLHFIQHEGPLEKEMATYSSLVAWRIPWTEEPSGLQFMRSQNQT